MSKPPPYADWDRADRAFQRIWQRRQFSAADLDHIVRAVPGPGLAGFYLVKLARRHPGPVLDALRAMYAGGEPRVRAAAVECLSNPLGREAVAEMLRRALAGDPDAAVREAAAWRAVRLYRRELADDVAAAAERESGERRERLRLLSATLRDGHAVEIHPAGDATLWISTPRSNFLQVYVSREELASGGLAAKIEDVRRWRVQ